MNVPSVRRFTARTLDSLHFGVIGSVSENKKAPRLGAPFSHVELVEVLSIAGASGEAVPAIHRFVAARLERNFRQTAALTARRFEQLATVVTGRLRPLRFTRGAAIGATVGLISKALHREEFLLAGRKCERASAVDTAERFISVHKRVSLTLNLSWGSTRQYTREKLDF